MKFQQLLAGGMLLVIFQVLSATNSQAHELRPAVIDVGTTADTARFSMRVNLEALISEKGPEHKDSDAPQSRHYQQLRSMTPDALEAAFRQYLPTLLSRISVESDTDPTTALPLSLHTLTIPPVGDTQLARDSMLILEAPAESARALTWQWDPLYGEVILRSEPEATDNTAPRAVAGEDQDSSSSLSVLAPSPGSSDALFSQYLRPGERSEPVPLGRVASDSTGTGFLDYIIIGFEHIIPKGMDHILFVIGLFLLAPRFKPILWQVSMFTLAHTLTLALGITGIITLSPLIVEPLIALSITVVCFENLWGDRFRKLRLAVVFAFGLLHGLGFAGVLSDIGLESTRFVSSLLAFNIGVELGQLSVVLLCFALVGWWFGNKSWYRQMITIPASLIIGGIGLYWFLQRIQIIS